MKKIFKIVFLFFTVTSFAQNDSTKVYKKRVLESTEVEFLMSYYKQNGDNASVTGGIGTEELTDITPTIVVSLPLNDDDVLTVDIGISAYTSASSSNLNPWDSSGASGGGDDDDDDDDFGYRAEGAGVEGSPWVASSGASEADTWAGGSVAYSHSSDNRNFIWTGHASFSTEYDYTSIGFGGSIAKLFNEKNTEVNIGAQVYLDTWSPKYPTELDSYLETNGNLNNGFFNGISIWDQNGSEIDKSGNNGPIWSPENYSYINDKARNSYSISVSFSQILSKRAQGAIFFDIVQQNGWLANPMQRVYFSDKENYYIGNPESIPVYTSNKNTNVFQLADDIERLPDTRIKTPIGLRFNYFINEYLSLRTYYRYYFDDWGVNSHTANIEMPIKISDKFTLYPSFRYYTQTAADYFAPYNEHLSTDQYYTSDYDLSEFDANQYGFGVSYTDIFTKAHIWKFGIKNIDLRFNQYNRSNGLSAWIVSGAIKFVMQ
ncbi:MAG: DUF3570 domain-containing protein [Flavobacteriaceae bacterium]|jgi:hypothetical protein|nr:DUF3570 domain-containing protein [Flavobacteriaceae bacterium]MBT3920744.1 DUF3570 domain-containing protein [Flavobacteriaceae bacterium]MBT6705747.1 DUF3570 domain-containing protein [Flavobacteriaceae bacterium]MBT7242161.1 DUF3570 domain-containing protein [Flavobacteriaceae bacterium]